MPRLVPLLAAALFVITTSAQAADPPDMVGTWTSTGDTAAIRLGAAVGGYAASKEPKINLQPRPVYVIDKQNGRTLSGYISYPGAKEPFVGVFTHDGSRLLVSSMNGTGTVEKSGDDYEWCWQDNLPHVAIVNCDVIHKTGKP